MGWAERARERDEADLEPMPEEAQKELAARIEAVQEALRGASLVGDPVTLRALFEILVYSCVSQGISEKAFGGLGRAIWRQASLQYNKALSGEVTPTESQSPTLNEATPEAPIQPVQPENSAGPEAAPGVSAPESGS